MLCGECVSSSGTVEIGSKCVNSNVIAVVISISFAILGASSSSISDKSMTARVGPCFSQEARKEEEFIAEMCVLSRLRHPCITTVMGAVVSYSHDPMLVMEYMEYGSLHDLLRNETMHLSG